jgi:F-box protein 11
VKRFLKRERELGRSDLILPLYYISAQQMDDPEVRGSDELARVLASRQLADWRELRFKPGAAGTSPR